MHPLRHRLETLAGQMQAASRLIARAAGVLLLLTALAVSANAIARALPGIRPVLPVEFLGYVMAITASWAFAYTLHEKAHVRIELLTALTPTAWRARLEGLALAALGFVAVALAFTAVEVTLLSAQTGRLANTPTQIPLVLPQGLWALGMIWFALNTVIILLRLLAPAGPSVSDAR